MIEILPHLYIGNLFDYLSISVSSDVWSVIHACKEPYHREFLGYTGRAAEKTDPEYKWAYRGNRLALNLIDSNNKDYIIKEIVEEGLKFALESIKSPKKTLIHCNKGESRAPLFGFIICARHTDMFKGMGYGEAMAVYKERYKGFIPSLGVIGFIHDNYDEWQSCQLPESMLSFK